MGSMTAQALAAIGGAGAVAVGTAGVGELREAMDAIERRRDAGFDGGMAFTFRNPARSADPTSALPSARAALVAAYPYSRGAGGGSVVLEAEVARYATSGAYDGLRAALEAGAEVLRSWGHRAVVVADDNALIDRAMALRAGLGWIGKNTNLLVPGVGSWVVLGSVLTDAELEPVAAGQSLDTVRPPQVGSGRDGAPGAQAENGAPATQAERGCGGCTRCLSGCPTGALVAPGVLDSGRCLSWLLQRTGSFPRQFRVALGARIYGCDDCQEVCPPSMVHASVVHTSMVDGEDARAGSHAGRVPIEDLLRCDDTTLLERFGSWYIARRDPRYVRRNALVVLGNVLAELDGHHRSPGAAAGSPVGDALAVGRHLLEDYLDHEDPLMVEHAAWAARRAGCDELLTIAPRAAHAEVRAELARPHPRLAGSLVVRSAARETRGDAPEP